jgi:diacylglycerol O-acyltransferase / wax synthase
MWVVRACGMVVWSVDGAMSSEHLSPLDATFLELEDSDQGAHMHIGAVMIFDAGANGAPPELADVRARIAAALPDLPRFAQRLSEARPHGLGWPRWVDDEQLDLTRHVRRAALPEPAGTDELLEWAGDYYSQRLDRSRPLWEIVVLDLDGGRWAMVTKTHHCMVDGIGSIDIGYTILDAEPSPRREPGGEPETTQAPPPKAPEPSLRRQLASLVTRVPGVANAALGAGVAAARGAWGLVSTGVGSVVHPERARRALNTARGVAEVLIRDEIIAAPRTSLNQQIGAHRRLAVAAVPLDDLKAIKRRLGGTVNDVVLASAAGGLRALFEHRGEPAPERGLRAMVPVNVRTASERLRLGNRITSLFIHLPVAGPDPLSRYLAQLDEAEEVKAGIGAVGASGIIDLTSLAPPILHVFLARSLYASRLFNVTITNVPGPQQPLYAFGSRLRTVWPLVPLASRHPLALAVLSYDGTVFFCLNSDPDAAPDVKVVLDGIEREIEALGELSPEPSRGHAAA